MKPRSFFGLLAMAAILLVGVAGVGLAALVAQSPLGLAQGGVNRYPVTAALVPRQSPVMVSLLVNPDRLEAFTQLAVHPQHRRRSHQAIRDLEQSLLAKTGLDYDREIRPWLGEEVTLAVTDLDYDHRPENGAQPGYLLIAHTKDAELSREFLQLAYAKAAIAGDRDLVFDQYNGVNLTDQRPLTPQSNSDLRASAVVGDYVLFANHPQVLRQALNSLQAPALALTHHPAYEASLASLTEPRWALVYGDFPALSAWLSHQPQPETPALEQTLTVTLALQGQGLVARTALTGVQGTPSPATPVISAPLLPLPASSALGVSGQNLAQQWHQILAALPPTSPLAQTLQRWLTDWQTPLGLDLVTDIFAWVTEDYEGFLLPTSQGMDGVFITRIGNGDQTQQALDHLDQLAIAQGYQVAQVMVDTYPVTAWTTVQTQTQDRLTRLTTQVRGVHCQVGDQIVLASSLEALSRVLQGDQASTLPDQPAFAQALKTLGDQPYGYVDWPRSEPWLSRQFPLVKVVELALNPLFTHLQSVTFHSGDGTPTLRNGTFYLNLGVPRESP